MPQVKPPPFIPNSGCLETQLPFSFLGGDISQIYLEGKEALAMWDRKQEWQECTMSFLYSCSTAQLILLYSVWNQEGKIAVLLGGCAAVVIQLFFCSLVVRSSDFFGGVGNRDGFKKRMGMTWVLRKLTIVTVVLVFKAMIHGGLEKVFDFVNKCHFNIPNW